jgi:hypothetical protein
MPQNTTAGLATGNPQTSFDAMGNKQLVSDLLTRLPDDVSLRTIAKKVDFMAGVREGLEQLERAEGVPIEAVEKTIASWNTR